MKTILLAVSIAAVALLFAILRSDSGNDEFEEKREVEPTVRAGDSLPGGSGSTDTARSEPDLEASGRGVVPVTPPEPSTEPTAPPDHHLVDVRDSVSGRRLQAPKFFAVPVGRYVSAALPLAQRRSDVRGDGPVFEGAVAVEAEGSGPWHVPMQDDESVLFVEGDGYGWAPVERAKGNRLQIFELSPWGALILEPDGLSVATAVQVFANVDAGDHQGIPRPALSEITLESSSPPHAIDLPGGDYVVVSTHETTEGRAASGLKGSPTHHEVAIHAGAIVTLGIGDSPSGPLSSVTLEFEFDPSSRALTEAASISMYRVKASSAPAAVPPQRVANRRLLGEDASRLVVQFDGLEHGTYAYGLSPVGAVGLLEVSEPHHTVTVDLS